MKKTIYICDICGKQTETNYTKMSLPCEYEVEEGYTIDNFRDCDVCLDCKAKIVNLFKERICHLMTNGDGIKVWIKEKELN